MKVTSSCLYFIKRPARDAFLDMGGILAEGSAISAGSASLPTYSVFTSGWNFFKLGTYLVALGKFSEFGVMLFQPIREVT